MAAQPENECLICAEGFHDDEIVCRYCSNSFHCHCLYMAYMSRKKEALNGRCPYCTRALPIAMRIHLSDKDINAWLMTAVKKSDDCYAFTKRREYSRILCDPDLRYSFTTWKDDRLSAIPIRKETFDFYSQLCDQEKTSSGSFEQFTKAAKLLIETDDKLLVAFYRAFEGVVPDTMTNEDCRRLMREYLKLALNESTTDVNVIREIEANTCPQCKGRMEGYFCKHCIRAYKLRTISFIAPDGEPTNHQATIAMRDDATILELESATSLKGIFLNIDRLTENEAWMMIDPITKSIESSTHSSNTRFIESVDKLKALLREALVPLILSTLELTPNAAIFVPLERKRAIARHAYLQNARVHLSMAIYDAFNAIYCQDEEFAQHLITDVIYTLEDIEEELYLIDNLIIENSLETIIKKHEV